MSSNNNKIPRIRLTRDGDHVAGVGGASSPLDSFHSLTRIIRESFRLHNVRREKKKRKKKKKKISDSNFLQVGDSKRIRSKSLDQTSTTVHSESCNEISEVGCSDVTISEFPITEKQTDDDNGQTTCFDDKSKQEEEEEQEQEQVENVPDLKQETSEIKTSKPQPSRQCSVPIQSSKSTCSIRRKSKDDSDISSDDAHSLRKRFARLLVSIRANKFTIANEASSSSSSSLPKIKEHGICDGSTSSSSSSTDSINK